MRTVIFDLDGTLSDPSKGITKGINHSLRKLGLSERPAEELLSCIGPPLRYNYEQLLPGADIDTIYQAIGYFREYYRETGYAENVLYPGIREMLQSLRDSGFRICLATGKKTVTAVKVLRFFGLYELFDTVLGCGDGGTKAGLIQEITDGSCSGAVMVGDRSMDFEAAAETGIPCVGVLWGFGTPDELAEADLHAASPEELLRLLHQGDPAGA